MSASFYTAQHLSRIDEIRIKPEGYSAFDAQRRLLDTAPRDVRSLHSSHRVIPIERPDVFISHTGQDKETVARPLAGALKERGYSVWFDEWELQLGDSLSEKIDQGLAASSFGLVVLSEAFFGRIWPRRELEGLVAREVTGSERVILPVWHGIDERYLALRAPVLANRVAVSTDQGIIAIVEQVIPVLERRLRPSLAS